ETCRERYADASIVVSAALFWRSQMVYPALRLSVISSRPRPQAFVLAMLLTASTVVVAQEGIRAVTLSSGGMAEIHRAAKVGDDNVLRLQVPLAQVDDILKTLVVHDPAGAITGVTLDGLTPVDETFARLPFT